MGVDNSAVARVVGVEVNFVNRLGEGALLLPQRVALVGQGATAATYAITPAIVFTANQVGTTYGFGSPLHLAALQLLPVNGDGIGRIPLTVYPLQDDGGGAASAGDITPTGAHAGTASYRVICNGIKSAAFIILDGASVADITASMTAAITANVNMPVTAADGATVVDITAKWKGTSGDGINVSIEGPSQGVTFAFTQPTAGATNPDVDAALVQIVNVWESMVVNCNEVEDASSLDKFQAWGDGRVAPLVKKTPIVFCGSNSIDDSALITLGNGRKTDRINSVVNARGSTNLALQIAARAVARAVRLANNNPPHDYGGLQLTGLLPGTDADQVGYATRDALVQAGIGTTEVDDGVIKMSDTVTFYHPDGEDPPAYRHVVDIVKLQNLVFNLDLIFNSPSWDGAPLIPNGQVTVNSTARTPSAAKAAVNRMIDQFALLAILSNPEGTKPLTTAQINGTNPKRLDVGLTVELSGNAGIISIDLNFGFHFGAQVIN